MKLETLAKRIAEKSGCPQLEEVIRGTLDKEQIPMDCLLWQGAPNIQDTRIRLSKRRDGEAFLDMIPVRDFPRVQITYQGKRHYVPRLVYALVHGLGDREFRLRNRCGQTTCVNPFHWYHHFFEDVTDEETMLEALMADAFDVTDEDAEIAVDQMLTFDAPKNWDDVQASQFRIGIPDELIITAIRRAKREYLLP